MSIKTLLCNHNFEKDGGEALFIRKGDNNIILIQSITCSRCGMKTTEEKQLVLKDSELNFKNQVLNYYNSLF